MSSADANSDSDQRERLALRAGKKYEQKVHRFVSERWAEIGSYSPGPWISFTDDFGRERICQPDGLLTLNDGGVLIVEIKLTHTVNAWWQLRKLYQPVVEALMICEANRRGQSALAPSAPRSAMVMEIAKSGDPLASFPEPVEMQTRVWAFHTQKYNLFLLNL